VDLSGYPDLVVVYLGMRVNALAGLKTLLGFGRLKGVHSITIGRTARNLPDGVTLSRSIQTEPRQSSKGPPDEVG
jgi:hypothetical protein